MNDLRAFRVFLTTYEQGGIKPAAEVLGRTPSAISMMLKQLEGELGGKLFEGERKNRLSELGELVLEQARELLTHFDGAKRRMLAHARQQAGHVRIASVTSVSLSIIPEALRRLFAAMPTATADIVQGLSRDAHKVVRRGAVDFAIVSHVSVIEDLDFKPLFQEPMDVVVPAGDILTTLGRPLRWEDLEDRPFIHNGSYSAVSSSALASLDLRSTLRGSSVANVIALARAGLGVSILPRLCGDGVEGVAFQPLEDAGLNRVVGLLSRNEGRRTPTIRRRAHLVCEVIGDRAPELGDQLL
ncbi:MAG: LysR family transcriptional regulator [Pikeienuella sp.]